MGSSLGHRSTRHGKRDGRRADPRGSRVSGLRGEQGLNKTCNSNVQRNNPYQAALAEVCGGGWIWRTLIAGLIYGGQGSTPRRPKRASYAVSGRGSTLVSSHEKCQSTSYRTSAFIPDSIEWEIRLRAVWTPMVCADSLQYFQPSMFAYCLVSDRMYFFILLPFR
jgi:hypothetical protein